MPTFFHHHLHLVRASSCIDSRSRVAGISDSPDRSAAPPAAMLSWKEKVAEKLSRLLADTPSSPHPLRGDYSPVASDDSQAIFLQEFASPEKSSYPSNFSSLTNTTNFGVDEREPKSYSHSHIVSSSAQHSLPKIWKSNLFVWKDGPSTSTEESETRSDCEEMPEKSNGNTGQISDQHINGFLTSNKVSTKHDLGEYISYLTEKSTFMSSDLFEFFQSCLPNIVKGCQWILLYRAAHGNMGYRFTLFSVIVLTSQAHVY